MNQHLQNIVDSLQQNEHLTEAEKNKIIAYLKDVNKELEITAFKLDRTEKVKRTTAILLEETIEELEKKRKDVEAQNRELEIESALERVRAATMSMRNSSELGNLIFHLYGELTRLDAKLDRCFIMIVNQETLSITWWLSGKEGLLDENGFLVQHNDYPSHQLYLKHWREKTTNWQYLLEGKEKEEWDQFGFSKTELAKLPEAVKRDMSGVKKTWLSGSSDSFGCLLTGSLEQLSEEHQNILSRFTKVFNQTYTRFLDLQKAEAQAREAQIQLALERVRARAMAMQKPSELTDVAQILRTEMRSLGVEELETSSIYIRHEDSGNTDCWYAIQKDNKLVSDYMTINLNDTWVGREMLSFYRSDRKKTTIVMKGEERKEWINYCSEHSNVLTGFYGDNIPDRSYHLYKFSNGYMGAASPGEISAESWDLLQRATSVFSLAYTRFNDLQLAEAQAREAQIETALERVRSRTMGMQKSDELKDVIRLVYEQFIHLKIHIEHTGFLIDYKTRDDVLHIWLADEHLAPSEVTIPWFDCPPNNSIRDAKNKGEDFFKYHLTFEEKNKFYRDLFQFVPGVPEETIDYYQNCPGLAGSGVLLESIGLYIENFSGTPYTDEENAVLMRFGKVFQQTYTRFLDLQKAEAQSREAQIQLALERVRARTMAMQKSDELGEVALLLFEQVRSLGIETYASGFNIFNQVKKNLVSWMSNPTGPINPPFEMPVESFKQHQKIYEAWKNNEDFLEDDLTGEALAAHYKFLRSHPLLDEAFKKSEAAGIETPGRQVHNIAIFSQGFLLFITFEPHPEFRDIFIRFAKVFEQTYTRFLDLQKAEAQAREAQIEAALERVRARTMAMQKSDELQDAASLLFQQIQALGIPAWSCGYNIFQKEDTVCTSWMSNHGQMQPPIHIPLKENATFIRFKSSKEKGEEFWIEELQGKKLKEHYGYLFSLPEVESIATENKKNKLTLPVYQINHVVNFSHGNLLFITYEHVPEAYGLFKRFGTTFEQTYSRFLDLQKAEAQARESQIQLALERVRARTMAMQKSEELLDVINIFSEQLTNLNIYFDNVSFGVNKQTDDFKFWLSSAGQSHPIYIVVPYCNNPAPNRVIEAQKDGLKFFADILTPEENRLWFQHLVDHSEIRLLPDKVKSYVLSSPGFARSTFIMKNINLYIGNYKNTPFTEEENNIFYRFAQAFEQSYIRFLDLQKAEAQAREAQIEAALERVRSRTMAMQKSDELSAISSELFKQVQLLGVPSWYCAFNINDEDPNSSLEWGSNGERTFEKYRTPRENIFLRYYEAGQRGETLFINEIGKEECPAHYKYLCSLSGVGEQLLAMKTNGIPFPVSQIDHVAFFKYGYILFITYDPAPEAHDIFKRFAKVFEQTYTRFLDLQIAEIQARESQIQLALERVRARTMAMQKSDELPEASNLLFQQIQSLGMPAWSAGYCIWNEDKSAVTLWMSSEGVLQPPFTAPTTEDELFIEMRKGQADGKTFHVVEMGGKKLVKHYQYMRTLPVVGKILDSIINEGHPLPTFQIMHHAYFTQGFLLFITYEPVPESHDIFKRFAKVFEQTYTRFLDLQKAEAQAREAQIQLALERVRAKTLSMQKQQDLFIVAKAFGEQLVALGLRVDYVSFMYGAISKNRDWNLWGCVPGLENSAQNNVIPYKKTAYFTKTSKSVEQYENTGNPIQIKTFTKKEKNEFLDHYFSVAQPLPDEFKKLIYDAPGSCIVDAYLNEVTVSICRYDAAEHYSDEQLAIFKRFSQEFRQAYIRFLDLQKAEAQAREAQIEAALEKVRSRSLAMHSTKELGEVVKVIVEKLKDLGVVLDANGVTLCTYFPDSKDVLQWIVSPDFTFTGSYLLPYFDHPIFNDAWESKERGDEYFSKAYTVKEKNSFFDYAFQHSDYKNFPDDFKQWIYHNDKHILSFAWQKNSAILIPSYTGIVPTADEIEILKRFTRVFEQAYIRFLDLQKAEAQAREAQIEAALERVRSRTMAMQKSDELNPTADLLFDQLKKLGADLQGVAFTICDKNSTIITKWTSIGIFSFPYTIEPAEQNMYEAWKTNVPLYEEVFEGERLRKYYETLMEVPAFKQGLQKMLDAGFPIPTWQKNHAVSFQQGYLLVITTKPFEETQIFVRFGKVFEQTYTRFLDLQKAEAQAREAQIEAALERVRSKAMSMHVSTELKEVASEMRSQLHLLGQKALETCAIHLYEVTPDYIETWAALRLPDSEDEMVKVEASYPKKGIRILEETIKNYSSKKMDYVLEVDKANEIELFEEIKKRAPAAYKVILESTKGKADDDVWVYWSLSDFPGGSLVMVTHKLPEENERKLLRRFSNVFGLAYQRFSDLQKAETSTREAIKQAALDRIRADIASMRTTEDLERITPVIWTELKILGIPFIRCGVFIMDEEKELIHTFLSTPEGKAITAIHIPYNTPGKIQLIPENWRANNPYTDHWQDTDFADFANILTQQKVITSPGEYLSSVPKGGFYLHFVPFLQGMMYVGNTTELSEEEINLIQYVADAFATAYARYEDFNKLEAAKKQVDSTLTELQSTQKQLIQSEKMASLGELTAGIAHEIQNPLNFVNNFSEVSKELLDEMKDAMDKGETEEAKEIMQDVINNLEKINHHGKRADAIVKGMLQHSRSSSGQKELTDISALCDEYLRLAYHGLRAKDKTFNAKFETDFDTSLPKINVVPQEIGRVILNFINNAFYAVNERKKLNEPGYEPEVIVSTRKEKDKVEIKVKDNGTGIPEKIKDKIFQPFFTTKPTGQGTGLGLSLAYDIITKGHGGELKVETKGGEGTEFVILLGV